MTEVSDYKYLGVMFANDLSWNTHVHYLSSKASRALNFIRRNFWQAPLELKELLYLTNVRPILEYGCSAWDPYTKQNINELERVQKRAARFVSGNYDFRKSTTTIRNDLRWPPLENRRKYLRLCLLYNIFQGRTGIDKDMYIKPPTYVSHRTDHSMKIREYRCRVNIFKYTFFPKTIHDWNDLPDHIVTAPPSSFSTHLQRLMFNF